MKDNVTVTTQVERPIRPALWGKDHWSTLAYIETLCVDYGGVPDFRRMRCDPKRHPALAHYPAGGEYPTRLRGGALVSDHDDWDCAEDLEAEYLIENIGTGIDPIFRLLEKGYRVSAELRAHRARGGGYSDFAADHILGIRR